MPIVVDMMNVLVPRKPAPKMFFHHKTVRSQYPAFSLHRSVFIEILTPVELL